MQVETDPRFNLDGNAMRAQLKLGLELRDDVSALNEALNRLSSLHKQITSLEDMIGTEETQNGQVNVAYKPVLDQAKALDKKLTAMQNPLYNTEAQPYGQDDIHYLQRFQNQLQGLMRSVMGEFGEAPSQLQVEEAASLRKELEKHLQEFNTLLNTDVAAFNKTAIEHGSSTLFAGGPVQIKSEGGVSSGAGDNEDEDQQ